MRIEVWTVQSTRREQKRDSSTFPRLFGPRLPLYEVDSTFQLCVLQKHRASRLITRHVVKKVLMHHILTQLPATTIAPFTPSTATTRRTSRTPRSTMHSVTEVADCLADWRNMAPVFAVPTYSWDIPAEYQRLVEDQTDERCKEMVTERWFHRLSFRRSCVVIAEKAQSPPSVGATAAARTKRPFSSLTLKVHLAFLFSPCKNNTHAYVVGLRTPSPGRREVADCLADWPHLIPNRP